MQAMRLQQDYSSLSNNCADGINVLAGKYPKFIKCAGWNKRAGWIKNVGYSKIINKHHYQV